MTPKTNIVIEKHKTIAATILPKPANGTPSRSHIAINPVKEIIESKDAKTPKIETQARGSVL